MLPNAQNRFHRGMRRRCFIELLLWLQVCLLYQPRGTRWQPFVAQASADGGFDPYQLNGGLLAAVAGRGYVILASDTRMMGASGYDILERHHLSSRLWTATPIHGVKTTSTTEASRHFGHSNDVVVGKEVNHVMPRCWSPDGSISNRPLSLLDVAYTSGSSSPSVDATRVQQPALQMLSRMTLAEAPVLIGSTGCQTDCETLKRTLRSEYRRARYYGETAPPLSSSSSSFMDDPNHAAISGQVAILLSQILYSRRGFPYYSFCLVAGMADYKTHTRTNDLVDEQDCGQGGQVYVYDAIGSYEQVAVATVGLGRELLQPILDRDFRPLVLTPTTTVDQQEHKQHTTTNHKGRVVVPRPRRLQPTNMVDCSKEEAMSVLLHAYRSVSEREIGVGDWVVFCVLGQLDHNRYDFQVWGAPLRKH